MAELMEEIRRLRQEMEDQQRRFDEQLRGLEGQLAELRGTEPTNGTAPKSKDEPTAEEELAALLGEAASPGPAPATAPPLTPTQRFIQSFNPDISLNADFLGAFSTREGGELDDEFLFRELEMSLSGAVDAYTRGDFFVAVEREDGEWAVDLEEGFLTFLTLPFDLQARVGKYRAEFGRANATHRHALPWVDYPIATQRFFGEEGLFGTGAELSWLVPNPWKKYISLTYEVFNNDHDTLFAGEAADDFTHLGRLKFFTDLSDSSTLEVGGSFATAPHDAGHGGKRGMVEGVDLTYKWKPKESGSYRSFQWQNEVLFGQLDRVLRDGEEHGFGFYSAPEYQFARRWKFGLRYDYVRLPDESSRLERAYSAYLTFLQSEFAYWRFGYQYADRNFEQDGNENEHQVFLQLNWNLGVHPAHKY